MKFADPKPPFCAACFQHSTGPHIDFEASWDGPVIEKDGLKIPVDDLILCESCVRAAARLFGMVEPRKMGRVLEDAEDEIEELRREVKAKDDVISDLTYTNTTLAEFPVKRRAGRPHFRGVPDDVKEALTKSKKMQAAQGVKK